MRILTGRFESVSLRDRAKVATRIDHPEVVYPTWGRPADVVCLRAIRRAVCGMMLFCPGTWAAVAPWTDDVGRATCADCLERARPGLL